MEQKDHRQPTCSPTAARGLAVCLLWAGCQPGVLNTVTARGPQLDSQLTRP